MKMLRNLPTVREQPSRDARAHLPETTLHHQAAARALATRTLCGHPAWAPRGLVLHTRGVTGLLTLGRFLDESSNVHR